MYTIGEFSIMSSLPKKTLRYYDEIGLLKPTEINKVNGYRLYDKQQLSRAKDILHYKELGLSLNDIKDLLDNNTEDVMNYILHQKMLEIEEQIIQLNKQKVAVNQALLSEHSSILTFGEFKVDKCTLPSGYKYEIEQYNPDDDIHLLINELYHNAAKESVSLISKHYIRKYVTETEDEKVSVFAYADNESDNEHIDYIKEIEAYVIQSIGMEEKDQAYTYLVDYMKDKASTPCSFIEKYAITNGKLSLSIYGVMLAIDKI